MAHQQLRQLVIAQDLAQLHGVIRLQTGVVTNNFMNTNKMQAMMQILHQLSQLDMGDAQLEHMRQENEVYPQSQEADLNYRNAATEHTKTQTAQMQDEMSPENQAKQNVYRGASAMGALGHGLGYNKDIYDSLMPQMASKLLGYVPDPMAQMKQAMMKHGLNPNNPEHVRQYQTLMQKLGH